MARWLLPHRPLSDSALVTAVLAPLREALCLSSHMSSCLRSSSQRWAEAASFLHGVCWSDSTFQLSPVRSAPTVPSLPLHCLRYADVARGKGWSHYHAELAAPEQMQREAARVRRGGRLNRRSRCCRAGRMWHLPCSPHWAPLLPSGPQLRLISRFSSPCSPGARLASESTRTTQLALMPSTFICSRSAGCQYCMLQMNAPSRCSHPSGPTIPAPGGHAAPAQAVEPAIITPAVPKGRSPPRLP